jgi:hypothetical protein
MSIAELEEVLAALVRVKVLLEEIRYNDNADKALKELSVVNTLLLEELSLKLVEV